MRKLFFLFCNLILFTSSSSKKVELTLSKVGQEVQTEFYLTKNQENSTILNSNIPIPLKGYSLDVGILFFT